MNKLINETSPYLNMHKDDLVDWLPWGTEAFDRAHKENKLIFLSIGYYSSLNCKKMQEESYNLPIIADLLNENFIPVKVDRDERPDLDDIYFNVVQLINGTAGWPLNLFITDELLPVTGGTYYPPKDINGMDGLEKVLNAVHKMWTDTKDESLDRAQKFYSGIKQNLEKLHFLQKQTPNGDAADKAATILLETFDSAGGGFNNSPKYPPLNELEFILYRCQQGTDEKLLNILIYTLNSMAAGGIYDHIGGGFFAFAKDQYWLVPSFEKTLYVNSRLASIYAIAFSITKDPLYKRVAEETYSYINRVLYSDNGLFYTTQFADSLQDQVDCWLWEQDEVLGILKDDFSQEFCDYYSINSDGNFNTVNEIHIGKNIPYCSDISKHTSTGDDSSYKDKDAMQEMRNKLLATRKYPPSNIDKRSVLSLNGIAISSYITGYKVLKDKNLLESAIKSIDLLLAEFKTDTTLFRIVLDGNKSVDGFLDDYSFFCNALLDVYKISKEQKYLDFATEVLEEMIELFLDKENGGFYYASKNRKDIILRFKPAYDRTYPSANASAVSALFRLGEILNKSEYIEIAKNILEINEAIVSRVPAGFLSMVIEAEKFLDSND